MSRWLASVMSGLISKPVPEQPAPCPWCGGVLYRTRAERAEDRVEVDVVSCSECEFIEEVK